MSISNKKVIKKLLEKEKKRKKMIYYTQEEIDFLKTCIKLNISYGTIYEEGILGRSMSSIKTKYLQLKKEFYSNKKKTKGEDK